MEKKDNIKRNNSKLERNIEQEEKIIIKWE